LDRSRVKDTLPAPINAIFGMIQSFYSLSRVLVAEWPD
jgi:hypothetical protein